MLLNKEKGSLHMWVHLEFWNEITPDYLAKP